VLVVDLGLGVEDVASDVVHHLAEASFESSSVCIL
nr:hypothetical protein [Tanacetum cinerariifolium]